MGWVITDPDVCSFYKGVLKDITDRTGHVSTVFDMVFEAKKDQEGNDWKEIEAEKLVDEELPF